MGLTQTLLNLLEVIFPGMQKDDRNVSPSLREVRRARFVLANIICIFIAITVIFSEIFRHGAMLLDNHVILSGIAISFHMVCCHLVYRVRDITKICRIWLVLGALFFWTDIILSGGISTPRASMFVVLPLGAGLLLGIKDVLSVTVLSVLAIALVGGFSIHNADPAVQNLVLAQTVLYIITTTISGAVVIVLTAHHQRIDQETKKLLQAKEKVARYDGLTGLLNRFVVNNVLGDLTPEQDRVNLFLADLDGFKQVNDAYGHQMGDLLLIEVARRIKAAAPSGAMVARLGGDEFLVLVKADLQGRSLGWERGICPGQAILKALNEPFIVDGVKLNVTGSIGIAHFPADAGSGEALLHRADLALYAAKADGRNRCFSFSPDMEDEQNRQLALQARLRAAVEDASIFLEYQPQFCLSTNQLIGFEALARWQDEVLGQVTPDVFITVAEECGLIDTLGEHVLRRACTEALNWPKLPDADMAPSLSVNISTLQLQDPNIVERIVSVLDDTGFPADRLELEVTESVLIADSEKVTVILNQLSEIGIKLAMDDFGKGYSSLSYLQNFSLSKLKIDRYFISDLNTSKGQSIVRAIVQLSKAMELKIVAEGVEDIIQRDALADMGCHFAQGFLYAPGLLADDAYKLIVECAARMGHRETFAPDTFIDATREAS